VDSTFLLKLSLSFLTGGVWVALATLLADRLGSRIGGLVSGLPSTVMFTLLFLAWTQSPAAAVQATSIIPIVGGINCLFLTVYAGLVGSGFWKAFLGGLGLWGILAYALVRLHFDNFTLSVLGYVCLWVLSFVVMEKMLKIRSVKGRAGKITPLLAAGRALLGGGIVALAVTLGKVSGPLLGGMFAVFPAMFASAMLVTYFSQGASFSAATMKSSLLSGVSVLVYALAARYTFVPLGMGWGTLVSALVAAGAAMGMYWGVIVKLK
jgi:hypothetical protein